MKKIITLLLTLALCVTTAISSVGCNKKTITVGASPAPHAEILEKCVPLLKEKGYKLKIVKYSDYNTPNIALQDGSLDANYFQHVPFMNTFNSNYPGSLVSVCKVHYEPFGLYSKTVSKESYQNKKTGYKIYIPNDGSNLTRALFLLEQEGLITLPENADPNKNLTVRDIVDSKGNQIIAVEARLVSTNINEGGLGVINGNYALTASISISSALAIEDANGEAASLYANILAVKKGNENSEKIKALKEVLLSETIKNYINSTYGGAVLSVVA